MNIIRLVFVILIVFICTECKKEGPATSHLGDIDFKVSGAQEAIPHFNEGLLLLHSFEYQDAAEKFRQAQDLDSNFVMAYWGEAMTKNHPLWHAQYYEEGREILERLGATPDIRLQKTTVELEKDLLRAVEILFGEGEKIERDDLYAQHMKKLFDKYKGNNEVAAFYALSLLGSVEEGRDVEVYEKGAIIADGILKENPNHPGALHYLIHSYDDPDHAPLALEAANSYSKVAPDAGHALHMPSHIYVSMGMWDEVIASNIASYDASLKRMERKNLGNDARNYHAYYWLQYGYLQRGDMDKAKEILMNMTEYVDDASSSRSRAYLSRMKATYLVESEDWDDNIVSVSVKDEDLNITLKSTNRFITGMQQYRFKDLEGLKNTIAKMEVDRKETEKKIYLKGAALCSGVDWTSQLPNQEDINNSTIMEMELRYLASALSKNDEVAEQWLVKAATLEENTSFMYGPPTVVKPSFELYGEWLLEKGRYQEAADQFDKSLAKSPKRRLSVTGKNKIAAS